MYNGEAFLFPVSPHPEEPSVDGSYQIVDVDAEVGIQPRIVLDEDVNGRHNDARYPKINACPVLQPEVEQSDKCTDNFKSVFHKNRKTILPPLQGNEGF